MSSKSLIYAIIAFDAFSLSACKKEGAGVTSGACSVATPGDKILVPVYSLRKE